MLKKARQKFPPSLQRMRGGPKACQKIPSRIPYAFKLFRWPMLKKKWLHAVEEGKKKKRKRQTLSPHTTPHGTPTSPKRRNNFFSTAPGAASPRRPFLLTLPHAAAPIFPTELLRTGAVSLSRRPHLPHGATARRRPQLPPRRPASSASLTPSATPSVPSTTPPRFVRLSATPRRHGSPAAPPHQVPPLRRTGRRGSSGHHSAPPQSPYRCVPVFHYRSIDSSC